MEEIKKGGGFVVIIRKEKTEFPIYAETSEDALKLMSSIFDGHLECDNGTFEVAVRWENE